MADAIIEGILDSLKILPFLFITYLVIEYLEKRTGEKSALLLRRAGHVGPLIGGALGLIPQCGFSAVASNFYTCSIISTGTLLAVYLSTSDEMIPIMISNAMPLSVMLYVLLSKFIISVAFGFAIDGILHRKHYEPDIEKFCRQENCRCEDGIFKAAVKHTINIFIFILIIETALNIIIYVIGEEQIASAVVASPVSAVFISGAIGLIPNCSASVIITQLYADSLITTGPLLAGLLTSAGTGLLVLFRTNRGHLRQNISIIAVLYAIGCVVGIITDLSGITFA